MAFFPVDIPRAHRARGAGKWFFFSAVLLLLLFALLLRNSSTPYLSLSQHKLESTGSGPVKIVGLVPSGRRDRLSILDCYLRRNLVVNGGLLDEVHFITSTEDEDDLKWMNDHLSGQIGYVLPELDSANSIKRNWTLLYSSLERNTYYLKIDDDVVFIADGAIEAMLHTKLNHPELAIVSANVVNHPLLSWVHYHHGATRPYLPELDPPTLLPSNDTWRASELPEWKGSHDFTIDQDESLEPPFHNHRWLPVKTENDNLDRTPAAMSEYDAFGQSWKRWEIAAQEHYSLLEHLETDPSLRAYDFGLWHYFYDRSSINFILFLGDDILDNGPVARDDEYWLTVIFTKNIKRYVGVTGKAVVAHFAYNVQKKLESTDLLSRYQAYANEKICRYDKTTHFGPSKST